MPTYTTSRVSPSIPARDGLGVIHQICEFTVGTALAGADIINLITLPEGSIVLDLYVSSGGTQSGSDSQFSIGDAAVPQRYIAAAGGTALRTGGGLVRMSLHGGVNFVNTADTTLILTIQSAGTGQTTGGVIRAAVTYVAQA